MKNREKIQAMDSKCQCEHTQSFHQNGSDRCHYLSMYGGLCNCCVFIQTKEPPGIYATIKLWLYKALIGDSE